jgi:hypothetical protein
MKFYVHTIRRNIMVEKSALSGDTLKLSIKGKEYEFPIQLDSGSWYVTPRNNEEISLFTKQLGLQASDAPYA